MLEMGCSVEDLDKQDAHHEIIVTRSEGERESDFEEKNPKKTAVGVIQPQFLLEESGRANSRPSGTESGC
jgi:hypothetical protein